MPSPPTFTAWDKAAVWISASAALLEQRITGEIRANTQRTDAQMEELHQYMVNHLDRQSAGAPSAPEQ
ncbi:MAG: hypothetical protein OXH69_12415 [Acidobacteria bacterium]|nr:hypothetical protein [Acidobacteriota bacterium]